jgi:protein-S-isoprenylcysteine O-methyltransferase
MHPLFNSPGLALMLFHASWMAWIGLEVWINVRERGEALDPSSDRGSKRILLVPLMIGIAAANTIPHLPPAWIGRFSFATPTVFGLGVVLIWLGIAVRWWAVVTLGRAFRTLVVARDDAEIVRRGPYRFVRHPSYLGTLLSLLGLGLALGNLLCAAAALLGFAGNLWRIKVEEDALRRSARSAYAAYMASTWRLVPFVW